MTTGPLRVPLGELTRTLGVRVPIRRDALLEPLAVAGTRIDATRPVVVDLTVEAITGGVVAEGTVAVPWVGECRRCLEPVEGTAEVEVREIFESRPVEGETYPLGSEVLDLEPMVRDAALLAVPLAPVCDTGCGGPDPDRFPTGAAADDEAADNEGDGAAEPAEPPRDPRWAALDALRGDQ